MKIPKKNFIQRLFCSHDYQWFLKPTKFFVLGGESQIRVCRKCGKNKGERFIESN